MNRFWMILFLLLVWCGFSNNFTWPNIFLGFIFSVICHYLIVQKSRLHRFKLLPLINLLFFTLIQLIKSSIEVAWDIIRITPLNQPQIIDIPLDCENDIEKMLLANLISLTPGTLTINLSKDKKHLVIHAMFAKEPEKIVKLVKKSLEPRVLKVFDHA